MKSMMEKLKDMITNAEKYCLQPLTVDGLRELYLAFDKNPFFPMNPYDYAHKYLYNMYLAGTLTMRNMQAILKEYDS